MGSIISDKLVLTTANCLQGMQKIRMMVLVSNKIFDNLPKEEEEYLSSYYLVEKIIIHDSFNKKNLDNDIGLVKVEWAFKGVKNMAKLPPHPASIIGTAVFFELFNFKMKIFPILGHLCIVSDRELKRFSF